MDLREALTQIHEIRQQVARTETFRGYKAAPVAFSGIVAWTTAAFQYAWMPSPADNIQAYLALWMGAALLSMAATGLTMFVHCMQPNSALRRTMTLLAIGQFLPCVVAGGLLTFVLAHHAPQCLWMLPGLWCMFFSLGIFASYRLLPKATFWVAVFYLGAAVVCLMYAQDAYALSPWAMGVPFGVGQPLAAGILYWTLERTHDEG